ncbi:hypothetical protein E1B28_009785 [Marasmius oreades]|uniref:Terpene synthase n=1 Tax=Marasmius oreades TaxID=181124 RepID=A0A9P7RX89_9AGAR|nr:uncharacterized protein E1B28_009785 [Marasmius oreades]KAG7090688.1 hypothetical protein E1B28_009785 [Marasmius oreades]
MYSIPLDPNLRAHSEQMQISLRSVKLVASATGSLVLRYYSLARYLWISESLQENTDIVQDHKSSIVATIHSFLEHISYATPTVACSRRRQLVSALDSTLLSCGVSTRGVPSFRYHERVCEHAAAMSELSFHDHDFETQVQIAKFTWFMIYIDDLSSRMPSALEDFQSKLFSRELPNDPVLQLLTEHLSDMYRFWDPLPANCITGATLEFVTGCALEINAEIQRIEPSSSPSSWPYYLRAKTGVAPAYAFMIFKTISGSMSRYMQVIADICLFIDLTNDVLSFYKEELAGETVNYIHNRAAVVGKLPIDVVSEVASEALAAYDRVTAALQPTFQSDDAIRAWKTFVNGYVAFHMTQDRYQLKELF